MDPLPCLLGLVSLAASRRFECLLQIALLLKQIIDDVLDMTASSTLLGKPALNDLRSGLATAPVLLAAEEQPDLKALISRRFKKDGDVAEVRRERVRGADDRQHLKSVRSPRAQAVSLIERSQGVQRAQALAEHHCALAADLVRSLPEAPTEHAALCRQALIKITDKVLHRKK